MKDLSVPAPADAAPWLNRIALTAACKYSDY
ncbi:hypothetical protein JOE40_001702 [Arthrobacter sp. PvP102]|jgi:hypothetical protein|nr:hypothetical protein [Arthrobacter sp. PvP023]MBP1232058.1 hypothetical protein [Arthrobacter sp. PvP103]MBP1237193.1 hypothetical protein [Arthrobacter sp. PvP102]